MEASATAKLIVHTVRHRRKAVPMLQAIAGPPVQRWVPAAGRRVLVLEHIGIRDAPSVGTWAAHAGEALSALSVLGSSVPHGFAVTAEAVREHLRASALEHWIASRLRAIAPDDAAEITGAACAIQRRIQETPLTGAVDRAVVTAADALACSVRAPHIVAVRTSTADGRRGHGRIPWEATAASQAIDGLATVPQAIVDVIATLYAAPLVRFRLEHGLLHDELSASVAVLAASASDTTAVATLRALVDAEDLAAA